MLNTTLCHTVNRLNGNLVDINPIELNDCVKEYGELITSYVAGNLDMALCAKFEELKPNAEGEIIYRELKNNAALRERIINLISAHGLIFSLNAYKWDLNSDARQMHFMQHIYNFLQPYHIFSLAKKYMDIATLVTEKKEQSR